MNFFWWSLHPFLETLIKLAQEPLKLVLQKQTFDQKVHLKSKPLYECLSNITLSGVSWIQIQTTREHQNIFYSSWETSKCKFDKCVDFQVSVSSQAKQD